MWGKGEINPAGDFTLTFDHLIDIICFIIAYFHGLHWDKELTLFGQTHIVFTFTPVMIRNAAIFHGWELPRAQARVSKQIGSRPGVKVGSLVTGRWLDNWFINPIHNRLIFPQPDACPEMRWKIHEKVLRYFFSEFSQFVLMSPVNESWVSGFIDQ